MKPVSSETIGKSSLLKVELELIRQGGETEVKLGGLPMRMRGGDVI